CVGLAHRLGIYRPERSGFASVELGQGVDPRIRLGHRLDRRCWNDFVWAEVSTDGSLRLSGCGWATSYLGYVLLSLLDRGLWPSVGVCKELRLPCCSSCFFFRAVGVEGEVQCFR